MHDVSTNAPVTAAAEVLRTRWNRYLPVRVDLIAQQMGVRLNPTQGAPYSGHFYSAADTPFGAPLIEFNTSDSAARQRFTIAHELGHYILGHGTSPRDYPNVFSSAPANPNERAANQFAAELLMPAEAVQLMLNRGYRSIDELANIFGVSSAAMGYRMINLGLG